MDKFCRFLLSLGADDAKVIAVNTIATAAWTVYKCQYGCGMYGKSLCCPPHSPDHKKTREIIDGYQIAIIFHCQDMKVVTDIAVKAARELFINGYYKAIALGSGPCKICPACNLAGCKFPGESAPSMEACGIDVFQTARANGYEISTLKNKTAKQNHFGLLLVE